jgi:hypothetical protein
MWKDLKKNPEKVFKEIDEEIERSNIKEILKYEKEH